MINLSDGKTITSRGMVGFMLNEGFVEKLSNEFCSKQDQFHPGEFYHSIAPQYIPYVNICNYITQTNPNINIQNIFSINYETCLEDLSEEQRNAYKKAECVSYAVRHGESKVGRKINATEVISTNVEKVDLDLLIANMTIDQLEKLRESVGNKTDIPTNATGIKI